MWELEAVALKAMGRWAVLMPKLEHFPRDRAGEFCDKLLEAANHIAQKGFAHPDLVQQRDGKDVLRFSNIALESHGGTERVVFIDLTEIYEGLTEEEAKKRMEIEFQLHGMIFFHPVRISKK